MRKKLTITIDAEVYKGLHETLGKGEISQFIENLVRPYVVKNALDESYRLMSMDSEREEEALEWSEALIGDLDE